MLKFRTISCAIERTPYPPLGSRTGYFTYGKKRPWFFYIYWDLRGENCDGNNY